MNDSTRFQTECAQASDDTVLSLQLLRGGRIMLDRDALLRLRHARLMSQQDLADDCWRRNIRVSLPTIKRAERGRAVRFRIARELARCFEVPVVRLIAP